MAEGSTDPEIVVDILYPTKDMSPDTIMVKITDPKPTERDVLEMNFKAMLKEKQTVYVFTTRRLEQEISGMTVKDISTSKEKIQQCMHDLDSPEVEKQNDALKKLVLDIATTEQVGVSEIKKLSEMMKIKAEEHHQEMEKLKSDYERELTQLQAKRQTLVICFEIKGQLKYQLIDKKRLSTLYTKLRDNMDIHLVGIDVTLNFIMEAPKQQHKHVQIIREKLVTVFPPGHAEDIQIKSVSEGPSVLNGLIKLGEKIPFEAVAGGLLLIAKTADVLSAINQEIGSASEQVNQTQMKMEALSSTHGENRLHSTSCSNYGFCNHGYYHWHWHPSPPPDPDQHWCLLS